jgi:uncharacterized membrane protein
MIGVLVLVAITVAITLIIAVPITAHITKPKASGEKGMPVK